MSLVKLGDSIWVGFSTANPTTGAAQTADSTPTIILYANGASMAYAPVPTNLATGRYQVQVDCTVGNGFADLQQIRVDVTSVVASILGANSLLHFNIQAYQMDDIQAQNVLVTKILRNKMITNPATGILTIYDDDGTTVLLSGQLYQDAGGITKYAGAGSERRERLT